MPIQKLMKVITTAQSQAIQDQNNQFDAAIDTAIDTGRRQFLRGALTTTVGATVLLAAPGTIAMQRPIGERVLAFRNLHTMEKTKVAYWENGDYLFDAIDEINHVLRDHRTGEVALIDLNLLDQLYVLQNTLENNHTFEVISGYRSPKTNRMLRKQDSDGVAKKSYHMKGMAIDVRLPGTELANLRKAAMHNKIGGVGFYPKSNFVHLDTGRVRSWRG
jgi:uncharacterized protein YcbK (DUF882 family)